MMRFKGAENEIITQAQRNAMHTTHSIEHFAAQALPTITIEWEERIKTKVTSANKSYFCLVCTMPA